MERINWTPNEGLGKSGWTGAVGRRKLFGVSRSVTRGTGWELRTLLPFNTADNARCQGHDADALKAYAEVVLGHFVLSLGAQWPGEPNQEV